MQTRVELNRKYLTIAEWNRKFNTRMPEYHPGKFTFLQLELFMKRKYGHVKYKSQSQNLTTSEPNPEYEKWLKESTDLYFGIQSLDDLKDTDFLSEINIKYPNEDIAEKCREISVWFAKYGGKMPDKTILKNNIVRVDDKKCTEMIEFEKAQAQMKRLIGF